MQVARAPQTKKWGGCYGYYGSRGRTTRCQAIVRKYHRPLAGRCTKRHWSLIVRQRGLGWSAHVVGMPATAGHDTERGLRTKRGDAFEPPRSVFKTWTPGLVLRRLNPDVNLAAVGGAALHAGLGRVCHALDAKILACSLDLCNVVGKGGGIASAAAGRRPVRGTGGVGSTAASAGFCQIVASAPVGMLRMPLASC